MKMAAEIQMIKGDKMFQFSKMLIFFLTLSINLFSQNLGDIIRLSQPGVGFGARALSMGNSYTALSDDASGMYFNPAGLGLIKKMEFSAGIDYFKFNNKADFLGNTSSYSNSKTSVNQATFILPFPTVRGSFVLGIGYHGVNNFTGALDFYGKNRNSSFIDYLSYSTDVPYDLYLTDDSGYTFLTKDLLQSGTIIQNGSLGSWSFSGAVEIAENLFFGATLGILSGDFNSNNDFYEEDVDNVYQDVTAPGYPETRDFKLFYLNRILNWDISAFNFKFGLLYQTKNNLRLGLTIDFPKEFVIKEKFMVDGKSDFGTGTSKYLNPDNYEDKVEYSITTPFVLQFGAAYSVSGLILSAGGEVSDQTQNKFKRKSGISPQDEAKLNKSIKNNFRATFNWNAGAEYIIPNSNIRVRGGFYTNKSFYVDDPSDFDKKYLTGGLGFFPNENISIDFAYAYGWWKTFGDNYGENLSRTYQDITTNKFLISFNYRF